MKVTETDLEKMLIEAYEYTFRKSRDAFREEDDDMREYTKEENKAYQLGKINGEHEAFSSILLQVIGGKRLYELWTKLIDENMEN